VLRRGRIAAEWYGRGTSATTPHIVFSVSKSISSNPTRSRPRTRLAARIRCDHGEIFVKFAQPSRPLAWKKLFDPARERE
jgi:hypothetical protein